MKKFFAYTLLCSFLTNLSFAFEDELANMLNSNLKIKNIEQVQIIDDFLPNAGKIKKVEYVSIEDEFLPKTKNKIQKPNLNFDFENCETLAFYVSPNAFYSTKNTLKVGQNVDFILKNDIEINKIKHFSGEIVTSRVENIVLNGAFGVPSELILGDFKFKNNNQKIDSEIFVKGANRTKWIYPTSIVLNCFFFAGVLLYPIRGGHAILKPSKQYMLKI